jgi:hypothetical protein
MTGLVCEAAREVRTGGIVGSESLTVVDPKPVCILYRNYRGETAARYILPSRIWYGSTEWHPEPQWLVDALDVERGVERSFALKDVLQFDYDERQSDVSD